ncbi:MAG: amidohydrolase [Alphaproteobacteria bacterium]|nr:amidohydrolase [Alphaproteobacteria bacterium]
MTKETSQLGNVLNPDAAWVAKVNEPALEPELPIVDPHHHLWQRAGNDYLFHDLLADTQTGHNIAATVFVDCHSMYRKDGPAELRCTGETEFANGVAAMSASGLYGNLRACAGIVGHVDLRLGSRAGAVFDAQIAAGNGRFKGIRHQTGWDADPGIRNVRTDPTPHDEVRAAWKQSMAELAKRQNIVVKVGGLGMAMGWFDFYRQPSPPSSQALADAFRPWVETCIDLFGPDRCMFESNFPVDKITSGYGVLWNAFKRLASSASAAEKTALFSGTARRVYKLA